MLGQPPFSRTPEYHPQAPLNPPEDENPLEWLAVRRLADEFLQRCRAAAATNPFATAIVTKLKSQSTDALGTRAVLKSYKNRGRSSPDLLPQPNKRDGS